MDKKLILYLLILAALVVATTLSVLSSRDADAGQMTTNDKLILQQTGNFEINAATDKLEPLYDTERGLSEEELGNGDKPSEKELAAFRKYKGEVEGTSPWVTFILFIITGIFVGFLIVGYVLPNFVQRASEEVLGSSERSGPADALSQAQALVAQGEWDEAIAKYRQAAKEQPDNRLPWVEIGMLQLERKGDPEAALATFNQALERGNWRDNDEAFFIFRKIEIQENHLNNHDRAVELLREVIERFPETRHSANANHKLHELGES
jgi:tetratricopeptide (TPR) repeat protein